MKILHEIGWDVHVVTPHCLAAALLSAVPPLCAATAARLSTHALFLADVAMFGTHRSLCCG